MEELPQIERSVEVPAHPEQVWERIEDGDLAEEWMGVRVEPRPGGTVTVPHRDVIGTVEKVEPGKSITWSWREVDGEPSQVRIDIEPTEDGSRVNIVERLLEYTITNLPPVFLDKVA
jgi:uncharacterized protein YndB with AHSA1/START domain